MADLVSVAGEQAGTRLSARCQATAAPTSISQARAPQMARTHRQRRLICTCAGLSVTWGTCNGCSAWTSWRWCARWLKAALGRCTWHASRWDSITHAAAVATCPTVVHLGRPALKPLAAGRLASLCSWFGWQAPAVRTSGCTHGAWSGHLLRAHILIMQSPPPHEASPADDRR